MNPSGRTDEAGQGVRVIGEGLVLEAVARIIAMQRDATAQVALDPLGRLFADMVADHRSPIVGAEAKAVDAEMVEEGDQLPGDGARRVVAVALVGKAEALEVDREGSELGGEGRQLRAPALPTFRQAVQEYHRIPLAGLDPVPGQAVDGGGVVGKVGHEVCSDGGGSRKKWWSRGESNP